MYPSLAGGARIACGDGFDTDVGERLDVESCSGDSHSSDLAGEST
jgi:hypothetical protein